MRRFGDPSARAWLSSQYRGPLTVTAAIVCAVAMPVLVVVWLGRHIAAREYILAGLAAATIGVFALGGIAALVAYFAHWRGARSLARVLSAAHPSAFVSAARVPALDASDISPGSWRSRANVGHVGPAVLIADEHGVCLWRPSNPPAPLCTVAWAGLSRVIVAEYVEQGLAYEGIALVDETDAGAIVVQMVRFKGPLVSFPYGRRLENLALRIDNQRSPTA